MQARVRSSVSLILALTLCAAIAGPALSAFAVPSAPGSPGLHLGRELSGERAIRVLGRDLAKVAAAHGKTTAALARALRSDKHLYVDPSGSLFYREAPAGAALGAPILVDPATADAAAGAAEAFSLHSKLGSKRVIYLDFDGHTISGTYWNSKYGVATIVAPAWDLEGDPSVFTDAERTTIAQIWARVAEDYAPFDVDVTTEYPGEDGMTRSSASDEYYGMRALISPISSYFGNYGGVACVGVFDYTSDTYKPALIFPEKLANSEKNIAEACSHEVGHTLGLLHDGLQPDADHPDGEEYYGGHGTGETSWAPIMGTGYSRNVTQWSRGEYADANNPEDDLVVIQANGLVYRVDDYANTAAGATEVVPEPAFWASGIIGQPGDVDTVTIAVGAGQFAASVAPVSRGPNLDIALELRTADGTLVSSAAPAATLPATITAVVAAGTYSLSVRGVGTGDPTTGYSDYASFGAWTLTGTAVPSDSTQPPNVAPSAVLSATPKTGTAPVTVAFSGSGSSDADGTIVSYVWSFGDGTTGSGAGATHTYVSAGTYSARLTVTDDDGATGTTTTQITVTAPVVSTSDFTPPSLPSAVSAAKLGTDSIRVSWALCSDNAGGSGMREYRVYDVRTSLLVATVAHPGTQATISGLSPNTRYGYYVKATDNAGNTTAASATAYAKTDRRVVRIKGADRFATAVMTSQEAYPAGAETVVVATGMNWPDALGGASLAGLLDAPILLTRQASLPSEVASEIVRLNAKRAIILGGPTAVSAAVEEALRGMLGYSNVERLAGANRYETAERVAAKTIALLGSAYEGVAFVATGMNFPDALGASPLAAANGWPIYLSNPNQGNNAGLAAVMKAAGVKQTVVLGGTNVVASTIESSLHGLGGVTRLSGANRYDTAVAVAVWGVANAGLGWDKVAVATGQTFPDALAGGILQGASGSVMLLTPTASLAEGPAASLTTNEAAICEVRLLGQVPEAF